jgi:hypothetical protein
MLSDRYGLSLSTSEPGAVAAYAAGLDQLISYDGAAEERLRAATAADPHFALPYAALAVLRWQQRRSEEAREFVALAEERAGGLTRREQQHIACVNAAVNGHGYVDGEGHQAPNPEFVRLARAQLEEYPSDALVLLLLTLETVFCGDPGERLGIASMYERLAPAYAGDWWFPGWRATCDIELTHLDVAQRFVTEAFEANARNPIAAHGRGHLSYEARDSDRGAEFLRAWLPHYDPRGAYHSHVSWHYAMLDLQGGRPDRALETYHAAVDPRTASPVRTTLADSVNFLWRFLLDYPDLAHELAWQPAREHALSAGRAPGAPLHSVLVGAALIGAEDEQAFEDLRRDWLALDAREHPLAEELVLPLLEGMHAFIHTEYRQAMTLLEPVLPRLYRMGGSNQQREMFEAIFIEARRRAGLAQRPSNGGASQPPTETAAGSNEA